jgi:Methyltransferase domain
LDPFRLDLLERRQHGRPIQLALLEIEWLLPLPPLLLLLLLIPAPSCHTDESDRDGMGLQRFRGITQCQYQSHMLGRGGFRMRSNPLGAMNKPEFKDHFSKQARSYAAFRPTYPDELFDWIAEQCVEKKLAWDVATGSGQAAVALARQFSLVIATDASAQQLAAASKHDRVSYRVATAEDSGLEAASCNLLTVAQALHRFHLDSFGARCSAWPSQIVYWWRGRTACTKSLSKLTQW